MQIHFGDIPETSTDSVQTEGLRPIHGPGARAAYWLAGLAGFLLLMGLALGMTVLSAYLVPQQYTEAAAPPMPTPVAAILITLLAYIPMHELLHLVWQPGWGLSSQSVLVLWPARLRFGVYYEGAMSRTRWLVMRAAPLVFLSLLPGGIVLALEGHGLSHALRTALLVLLAINTVGCGADVLAILLVLRQVPRSAQMCFSGGRAYWRPG